MSVPCNVVALSWREHVHPDRQADVICEMSLLPDAVEPNLVQGFPRRVFAREVLHGGRRRRVENSSKIVEVPRVCVWLKMLSQAPVHLQPVGHVVLSDDGVRVACGLLRQHRFEFVDDTRVDVEACELAIQHRSALVFGPLHCILQSGLY